MNETVPHLHLPAKALNHLGQCCGRKPLVYKRPHHLFCVRCCADFAPDGSQQENWAWKRDNDGFVSTYPDNGQHDFVDEAKRRFAAESAS